MHIFGKKKQVINCAICGKELGRHKYKSSQEWGIEGMLCGDCHLEKTREFIMEQKEKLDRCAICNKEISERHGSTSDRNKPKWQWEMESGTVLCKSCYLKKDDEYNKKMNFCTICKGKLGLFFYHPKPAWHLSGNLCRKCWDRQNTMYNDNNNNNFMEGL